jgi:peroxiredoxin
VGAAAVLAYAVARAVTGPVAAPRVEYTLLDGTVANSDQWRGKVVLVNFWSTDCVPCVQEMPQMIATHLKYRSQGLETLAVSMSYDPPADVIHFAETRKLPFGVAIDITGDIARQFGNVEATPTSVLVDRRGRIVQRFVGEPDVGALQRSVERLLNQS